MLYIGHLHKGRCAVNEGCIAANVARLRLDRQLTQEELGEKAGLSRIAIGKIERGAVVPRSTNIVALAKALGVPISEMVTPVRPLQSVRFRAKARVRAREQILAVVSAWLDGFATLEECLGESPAFNFASLTRSPSDPRTLAQAARKKAGLRPSEPVRDICGLLEANGIKLLLLNTNRDSFFGLSVGPEDSGPAVVVNTWDRISVERWIFTAVHELGHLLLHPTEYQREATELPATAEREADIFASEFLMPQKAFEAEWNGTSGHPLLLRVLKVKRIFGVSYKTVLYRLGECSGNTSNVWKEFQRQHRAYFGKTLRKADEPKRMHKTEFAWNWNRSGEPDGLSRHDFIEDRLSRLVRQALEHDQISLGRAAEMLGISRENMRQRVREWYQ